VKEPLAIVGIACRLPGADGIDAFWDLVVRGRTAWGPLPEARFSRELYFHPEKSRLGKSYSEMGAVVPDRPVDPTACPITPALLEKYDVAHHIFLEVASQACRDAGLDPFAMPGDRRTGVYVGHTGGSTKIGDIVYATGIDETATFLSEVDAARVLLGDDVEAVAAELTEAVRRRYPGRRPGQSLDLGALGAAKIVQEAMKLDGPFLVVDAACASSLQAMAIAARSLLQGGIDQAIVGGASYCKSDSLVLFSAAQSVSNAGSCPFGQAADGLITAEGYVAIVIKTLSRAVADGDRIRAVIRGLGVASDGKGKSLWAPRQEGQILAVERAYPDLADLSRLEYIEAHATSTQVGDATELGALSALMRKHLPPGRQVPIGSVKANIGHTLETAGIASLVKVVLAMDHGMIPPGSTCDELNQEFDWADGPFTVPRQAVAWPAHADGSPRCAAVNAFGIGGLNVHVALFEHLPTPAAVRPARAVATEADAIAVVGAGCVLPGALSLDAFVNLLGRGETAIGPVPGDRWTAVRVLDTTRPRTWHTTSGIGGFVRDFAYDWRRHKVPPKQIAAANPLQFMLLEAADAAIADAGGPQAGLDRRRTGVVVGTLFGGDFANQLQMGLRLPETGLILRAALARRGVSPADVERIVSLYEKKLLEKMPALVDETGSFTSSTLASRLTKTFDLMGGALALDAGDCSSLAAIAAAVDMLRERSCDAVLCAAGERCMDLMAYEGRSLGGFLSDNPISVLDGKTRGGDVPGEGAVVFVLKRLADAQAAGNRIRGVIRGVCVGSGQTRAEATRRVVREAVERSGLVPTAVMAVEVAVAGGHAKSGEELVVLGGHYAQQRGPAEQPPVVGSLDGQIGHAGAAAGAAAVAKLCLALGEGSMPPTVALATGAVEPQGLRAAAASLPIGTFDQSGYRAGSVTVIQERQVGHLVLDNGLPVPAAAQAGNRPQVAARPASRQPDVAERPLIAALFPGQGSQYTDMFRGLVEESAEARDSLARLDTFAREAGCETLAEIAWRPVNGLGTKIWDTQWAMYLGDLFAWDMLRGMGFTPDCIASHSFGEFPSLVAAAAWTVADGVIATRARAEAVEQFGPRDGAMLSIIADRATVQAAVAPFAGHVWICAENAPEQFVVGGTARMVDAVEAVLEAGRIHSKRLAVPSPFHTPLLEPAAGRLAHEIARLAIQPPRITTYGSTSAESLASAADVRSSLVRQMSETVRWIDTVENLYAAGVRTFVEVGPSGVLCGLSRRILKGRTDVTFVQFDQRGKSPREHLARLREQLAAAGATASGGRSATMSPRAQTVSRSADAAPVPMTAEAPPGRIIRFDATARRRERNRNAGEQSGATNGSAAVPAVATSTVRATPGGNGSGPWNSTPRADDGDHAIGATSKNGSAPAARSAGEQVAAAGGRLSNTLSNNLSATLATTLAGSNGAALLDRAVTPSRHAAEPLPTPGAGTNSLEELVRQLVAEAGVSLPLGRLGEQTPAVSGFLDSIAHLFEPAATDRSAVLAAGSLADLCSVLGRAGGKARWLPSQSAAEQPDADGIETFLIDFVVEQTGYPREIVELDADLEADLGIDSIRKAQLFGEIGQRYGLTADASLSLDDFTTLRHLLDYILPRVGGRAHAAGAATPAHAEPAREPPAAASAAAFTVAPAVASAVASAAAEDRAAELETFLIDFVVEQTGYPREIVELDADLEADLGIDSIRKAQLFGEIGQRYGLTADASLSLDDFTTLRHLLDYILPRVGASAAPASTAPSSMGVAFEPPISAATSAATDRGRRLGRDHAEAIRLWARQFSAAPPRSVPAITDPAIMAELSAIADAVGIDEAIVRAAYHDPARALGGCAAIVVAPRNADTARGLLACFGRGADPDVRSFEVAGLRATLVGVKGLPGAILGWNDAGLLALADPQAGAAAATVEVIVTTCRSAAEAGRLIATLDPIPVGLLVADLEEGGQAVSATGTLVPEQSVVLRLEPGTTLARVALADGATTPTDAIATFIAESGGAARAALSAAAPWLVVGAAGGVAMQRSGGPLGRDWLGGGMPGTAWVAAAGRQQQAAAPAAEVTQRYTLTTRELPPVQGVRSLRGERVLVLGDGHAAEAVRAAVVAEGAVVVTQAARTSDEAVAAVDRAEAQGPVRHLVIASARPGMPGRWLDRGDAAVAVPFFACQRWIGLRSAAGDLDRSTLTAVTDLGGDFGLSGTMAAVEGGAVAGLFKNLVHEFPGLHVRVVDAAAALPAATLAAGVLAEMRDGAGPVEVGLDGSRRLGVVACAAPAEPTRRLAALEKGSVWIATGGARGVTAACCRELGRRYPVRLVLLGSTHPVGIDPAWLAFDEAGLRDLKGRVMLEAKQRGADPRAAWRAVEKSREIEASLVAFRAAGVDARYEACDLADAAAVRAVVQRVERDLGPVRGIVHGAGFEAACRFEKKTREGLLATLAPKCIGLEHLLAALDPTTLEAVVGFGSTSGRLGGHGQADYSLANDLLAKIVGSLRRSRPGLRATVFHWHAWDEVGMASRPESRFVLEQFGLRFMPLAEGVRRFMDEIEAGLPDAEVLVTEPALCPDAVPATGRPAAPTPQPAVNPPAAAVVATEVGSLVERVESRPDGTWVSFRLDPTSDRFLIDHLQYGRPLLPAVMGAELLVQAVRAASGGIEVGELRDFVVERPIAFPVDAPREVRVEVGPVTSAGIETRGWTAIVAGDGRTAGEDRVHVHGWIVPGAPEQIDAVLEQPPFPFNPMYYQEDAPLRHGPSFRTLDGLFLDRSGGWGRLVSQHGDGVALPRGSKGWTIPVGLLDGCIVACAVYSYILCGRRVEIPVQFERLRVAAQPRGGEKCIARLFFRSQDVRETVYDVVLHGDDGRVILAVDGLHLAVVGGERGRVL